MSVPRHLAPFGVGTRPIRLAASLALAGAATACLGSGTSRVDAPCRQMQAALAQEMLRDNPFVPLLDVRRVSNEKETPIEGARRFPVETLADARLQLQQWAGDTVIVIGEDRETGLRACEFLSSTGFQHVIFVEEGAPVWLAHQRSVEPRRERRGPSW